VPHAVTFVDDVDRVDVMRTGAAIRHLPRFNPPGVCVSFAQVLGVGELALRTFEYGAETETLACGTGSATAALMAARRFGWPREYLCQAEPVHVRARSGDVLRIYFLVEPDGRIVKVCLETVVRFIYTGQLHSETAARAFEGELREE